MTRVIANVLGAVSGIGLIMLACLVGLVGMWVGCGSDEPIFGEVGAAILGSCALGGLLAALGGLIAVGDDERPTLCWERYFLSVLLSVGGVVLMLMLAEAR